MGAPFPVDRKHPPRRVVFSDGARHLELRPWSLDDVDALVSALELTRDALKAFMPWAHGAFTRESQFEFVTRVQADYWAGRELVFGVFSERGHVLGGLGLHPRVPLNPTALEVGYWCHAAHVRKGWTTLAVQVSAALVFDWFGADRLQLTHDEANLPSRRVAEKVGFVCEGRVRRMTAEVSKEVRGAGFRGTESSRLYGLTPEDLPNLAWLPAIRAGLTVFDALGGVASPRDRIA